MPSTDHTRAVPTALPPLPPRHFFEPSLLQTPAYLVYGLLLAIGPGYLNPRVAMTLLMGRIDAEAGSNGLPLRTLRWLCLVNVIWHPLLMAGLITVCISAPLFAVCVFIAPLLATVMITGLNPYQEHAGTGTAHDTKARSRTSLLFTALMLGTNYHLEHHLYPRVPCWRLPALHRWLANTDWYRAADPIVERAFIATFSPRLLSGSQAYGQSAP